jgi:peptidyl-prolyl cis-trans isomerase D
MFEAVRNNKRIAQVILGVISLTFAFWGVESYLNDRTSAGEVATVGDSTISAFEFDNALRSQQERMRAASEAPIDPATFDSPLFKRAVLDNLINQRVLAIYAATNGLSVSDEMLRGWISGEAAFQENGQFSMARYERVLRSQGMSVQTFQERLRADLANQQVLSALGEAAIIPDAVAARFLEAQLEERTVHMAQFQARDFVDQVKVDEAAARARYDQNTALYAVPAQIKAQYLVLTPASLQSSVSVSEEEIRAEYEQRKDALGTPEERKASHILIEVAGDAAEAEVSAAREKAEAILAKLKAAPDQFAQLASAESADPGSAQSGGDLGYFGRGAMLAEFEQAVFAAEAPGLIPEPVRTDFGFHIIRLDDIRASSAPSFEQAHDRIRDELVDKAASRRFLEVAEQFANMVYEQPDSLAPVAEAFGLTLQTTEQWIDVNSTRVGEYDSPALVKALFSGDVLNDKHNTDAIDVGDNTMVAARVAEHQPARERPFEEVRAEVEQSLRLDEAVKQAIAKGEATLAALKGGEAAKLDWGGEMVMQRGRPTLPPQVMTAVFAVAGDSLPAYTGMELPGAGYALFRIDAVKKETVTADDARLATIKDQYAQLVGAQDLRAFIAALRETYGVKINAAALAAE